MLLSNAIRRIRHDIAGSSFFSGDGCVKDWGCPTAQHLDIVPTTL
jgi:hypothetical protein